MKIQTRRVRAWMALEGLNQSKVARETGMSTVMVSYFVRGERGSDRLRRYFINRGCPAKYLGGGKKAEQYPCNATR